MTKRSLFYYSTVILLSVFLVFNAGFAKTDEFESEPGAVIIEETDEKAVDETVDETKTDSDTKSKAKEVKTRFYFGNWTEYDTGRMDYTQYITMIDHGDLNIRYDQFNVNDLSRLWVHYGKIPVIKGDDVRMIVSPGGIINNKGHYFYGGRAIIDFPKVGLSIDQRSYAGSKNDLHYTFTNLKVLESKNITGYIQYYRFTRKNYVPDCYIGPRVKLGNNILAYYGWSARNSKAKVVNVFATFEF